MASLTGNLSRFPHPKQLETLLPSLIRQHPGAISVNLGEGEDRRGPSRPGLVTYLIALHGAVHAGLARPALIL
ncbi:hypothetical protein KOW79_009612 [Hemibagrus wyckioides]|uniref:Uncharacterized protein n=1 Tax=Hemibagrus wyckioides TaxID=337641 RepID=A0A9D3SIZ4_9TELE|nr:hypothetical protein KOW79_009612 [Hemibagrus wyckioides]